MDRRRFSLSECAQRDQDPKFFLIFLSNFRVSPPPKFSSPANFFFGRAYNSVSVIELTETENSKSDQTKNGSPEIKNQSIDENKSCRAQKVSGN